MWKYFEMNKWIYLLLLSMKHLLLYYDYYNGDFEKVKTDYK